MFEKVKKFFKEFPTDSGMKEYYALMERIRKKEIEERRIGLENLRNTQLEIYNMDGSVKRVVNGLADFKHIDGGYVIIITLDGYKIRTNLPVLMVRQTEWGTRKKEGENEK